LATRLSRQAPHPAADAQTLGGGQSALAAYLAEFLKDPLAVGSPIPSFARTVDRLLAPVDWRRIRLLVEYGPGTGRFTAGALKRMRADATLIAIDSSPGFADYLRRAIPDRRLRPVAGSALDVDAIVAGQGFAQAECILSGIPFSTLPDGEGEKIVRKSHRLLRPGGLFLAYQVRDHIRPLLERHFAKIDEAYEWLNLPPYHLYWFRKDR
jgi:phospholipid N-methyltransferase